MALLAAGQFNIIEGGLAAGYFNALAKKFPIVIASDRVSAPNNHKFVVRSDLKGAGLGDRMMHKLIAHFRARGTQRLVASVLVDNRRMLELAESLGFENDTTQPEPGVRSIHLDLR